MSDRKLGICSCTLGAAYIALLALPLLPSLDRASEADSEIGGIAYGMLILVQVAAGCVPILLGSVLWHTGLEKTPPGTRRRTERVLSIVLFLCSLPFVLFLLVMTVLTGGAFLGQINTAYVALMYDLGIGR